MKKFIITNPTLGIYIIGIGCQPLCFTLNEATGNWWDDPTLNTTATVFDSVEEAAVRANEVLGSRDLPFMTATVEVAPDANNISYDDLRAQGFGHLIRDCEAAPSPGM